MASITFLFGAGADSPFKLSDGADFALSVIGEDPTLKKYETSIVKYYKGIKNDWYPKIINSHWGMDDLLKASIRKELLDDKSFTTQEEYSKAVNARFNKSKGKKNQSKKQINKSTSYMGLLDEHFHTLINPKVLGPVKFWRVVLCYARAYCCLVDKMIPKSMRGNYESLMKEPKAILNYMKEYAEKTKDNNYYKVIAEIQKEYNGSVFHVITSNYTTLCQTITGIDDGSIAYIHGKIGWFESAHNLRVYDVSKNEDLPSDDVLFPYLFVQSGIKPIVDIKQMREFSKMVNFLDDLDSTLIIVGYRFNEDDNHINSVIRSYLLSGGSVVYFSFKKEYKNDSEKESKTDVLKRLRMKENDLKEDQFKVENICEEDSFDSFRNMIMKKLGDLVNV